jgi:hypothetical protein
VAELNADSLLWQFPWGYHDLRLEKIKLIDRAWEKFKESALQ